MRSGEDRGAREEQKEGAKYGGIEEGQFSVVIGEEWRNDKWRGRTVVI